MTALTEKQTAELAAMEKRHAREREEHALEYKIRAALPIDDSGAPLIVVHRNYPALLVTVMYKPKDLRAAVALLDKFEGLPFLRVKDSCLSFRPRELYKPADLERAQEEMEIEDGAILNISAGEGYGPDAKLEKWTRVAGVLCNIECELGSAYFDTQTYPSAWRADVSAERDDRGRILGYRKRPPVICGDLPVISWGTGDGPRGRSYSYSWVWFEQATFHNEMERFYPKEASTTTRE